jgi:hypothetical protein
MSPGRWVLDRRLDRIWRISFGMSGPVPITIKEPRDFLTVIDFLPNGLLFTPYPHFAIVPEIQAGIEPPTSPETRQRGFRDLQDKVKESAKPGWSDRLELPTQILALMTLTNGVYGPGLRPHRLAGEALEVFIDILFISLVDFLICLDEGVKAVWLGPDSVSNEKYDIVAGFECGACQFAACAYYIAGN